MRDRLCYRPMDGGGWAMDVWIYDVPFFVFGFVCVTVLVVVWRVVGFVGVKSFRVPWGVSGPSMCGARVLAVYSVI